MTAKSIHVDITGSVSGFRTAGKEAGEIARDLEQDLSATGKTATALGDLVGAAGRKLATATESAKRSAAALFGEIAAGGGRAASMLGSLASVAGKGVAAGMALGGAAAVGLVRNTLSAAEAMQTLSLKTGLAVEELGGWKLATARTGTDLEALAGGLKHVSTYMAKHADNLRQIRIDAKTAEGVMIQLAGVLSRMDTDDPRRMALANKVLGDSYQALMPLLAEGEEGLRLLLERGRALNPITSELARESSLFSAQLAELKISAGGLGVTLATALLPHLNDIVGAMNRAAQESGLLSAVWAGMKGLAAHALGLDDVTRTRDRLREINSELATAAQMPGLTNSIEALQKEKAALEALLAPPKATPQGAGPSSEALDRVLNPGGGNARNSGRIGAHSSAATAYAEEARGLKSLMEEIGKLSASEQSHIDVLQRKLNTYRELDESTRDYLQLSIDQAQQNERLKLFEQESKKLLEENRDLNAGLLESDRDRARAQLALEYERSVERIHGLKVESEQAQALIEQEARNYELRVKKMERETEKTSDAAQRMGGAFAGAFADATVEGRNLSDVLQGLERDILRMLTREYITQPLTKGFGGLLGSLANGIGTWIGGLFGGGGMGISITGGGSTGFAARGAWFDRNVSMFAAGGIVDRPTPFRFAGGQRAGVMGEAGPEAIIPLRRNARGELGVQGGGAAHVNVQVNLIESPGHGGQVRQRQEEGGALAIDIMVEQIEGRMGANIRRGNGLAPLLEGRYGLNPGVGAVR